MRYLIFLIFSISLISDEGDIVERKILDTQIYKKISNPFVDQKLKNNESTWFEDFDNPQLSLGITLFPMVFMMKNILLSGWGNGELQYWTKPKKNNKKLCYKELIYRRWQPIRKPYKALNILQELTQKD